MSYYDDEYNYKCKICSKKYKTHLWFKNHLETVHRDLFNHDSEPELDDYEQTQALAERLGNHSRLSVQSSTKDKKSASNLNAYSSPSALKYKNDKQAEPMPSKANHSRSSIETSNIPTGQLDQINRIAKIESSLEAVLKKLQNINFKESHNDFSTRKNNTICEVERSDHSDYESDYDPNVISSKHYKEYARAFKETEKKQQKKGKKEKK